MAGTHYTLDRDKPENQNPMDVVKEKACGRCGTVKPNDFKNFGKKLWQTRFTLTTTDICIACQKKRVSDTMKARWRDRKVSHDDYQAEQLRMARTVYEANESARNLAAEAAAVVRPISQPLGSVVRTEDDSDGNVRPIDLAEALDFTDTGKMIVDQRVESLNRGPKPAERVETLSEVLMSKMFKGT